MYASLLSSLVISALGATSPESVVLAEKTEVRLILVSPLSTAPEKWGVIFGPTRPLTKAGSPVLLAVSAEVKDSRGLVVIPKNSLVNAQVSYARVGGSASSPGRLVVDSVNVVLPDGREVPLKGSREIHLGSYCGWGYEFQRGAANDFRQSLPDHNSSGEVQANIRDFMMKIAPDSTPPDEAYEKLIEYLSDEANVRELRIVFASAGSQLVEKYLQSSDKEKLAQALTMVRNAAVLDPDTQAALKALMQLIESADRNGGFSSESARQGAMAAARGLGLRRTESLIASGQLSRAFQLGNHLVNGGSLGSSGWSNADIIQLALLVIPAVIEVSSWLGTKVFAGKNVTVYPGMPLTMYVARPSEVSFVTP